MRFASCCALVLVLVLGLGPVACEPAYEDEVAAVSSGLATDGKMDVLLKVLVDRGVTPGNADRAFPKRLLRLKAAGNDVLVDVLLQASTDALPRLAALGVQVRTVTDGGVMTATVPIHKLRAVAALDEVGRIEAARAVRLYNDLSNDLQATASGTWAGMNNARSLRGAGVVVGVLDTGLDWTHKDFIQDATEDTVPRTRIAYYWDQSDTADLNPPADLGFAYGHEYVAADFDDALQNYDSTWDPATNTFGPVDAASPIRAPARDVDGHGTHVAGTAAGDGSGSGMMGVAPEADIIFVKFDFDGDRNTDAAIVDGVNYIFRRAAAMGKPCVVNMSLGSDYGPHDGNTLEERGLNDLAGPGRMVVVAAGNPGVANWSRNLPWGYALHGSGALNVDAMTFRFPAYTVSAADDYVFFDLFYPTGNKCQVKVTTPSGVTYPPAGTRRTWITGSAYTGYNTAEGGILVGNGGDQLGWGMVGGDNEVYIEVSDYWGVAPASGTWTFQLVPADSRSVCSGTYHAWYGVSGNIVQGWRAEPTRDPTPRFGGRESDNRVTIGTPASAGEIIAVAAYQSRQEWPFAYGTECLPESATMQSYGVYPISYYDPMAVGELATFSARGPRRDGVLKPEIAAPGVGIASSLSHFVRQAEWPQRCTDYWAGGPYHFGTNRVLPNLEATVIQGTSMATPNATGATALFLQARPDLDDRCLRHVFATASRHDAATDTYRNEAYSEFTDTDTAAGPGRANHDWGYGKLDIDATLAALAAYPSCDGACTVDADCGAGYACVANAAPCACNACVLACLPLGAKCATNDQCCSGVCTGKANKKVCK